MAIQSLAVKYRPNYFSEVVEQEAIKKILGTQIETKTTKNAYLFSGGAGTGKTTSARIFAKEINKGKGKPIEIDGASNNSVEDVRKIIEDCKFQSLDVEFKTYIIDECHMLSTGAWNAMLKLLEEPPAKTIIILCTTDPQKIPATILSRVQRFDFKRISYDKVVQRLEYILCKERSEWVDKECKKYNITPDQPEVEDEVFDSCPIKWDQEAIEFIARIADGGMRDAITLLDKCLSYSQQLTLEATTKALDFINFEDLNALFLALYKKDSKLVIELSEKMYKDGIDIKLLTKQLLSYVLNIHKFSLTNDYSSTNIPRTVLQANEKIDINITICLLDLLVKLNEVIKWETSPKVIFQANLLRWCRA